MDQWTARWDERYKQEGYAYGTEPNQFLKEQLSILTLGSILFPAEGQGRNAVYAARQGWNVSAFDISEEGRKKALLLAEQHQVLVHYQVGTLENLHFPKNGFDAMALIYAHFPASIKSQLHVALTKLIKINGIIVFEAFSKKHLEYRKRNEQVGGPADIESLFSLEEIQQDFSTIDFELLEEKEIHLNEGDFHNGLGSVIRFVGRKISE